MLDRQKLKAALKAGSQVKVAKRAGRSNQVVCDWFAGRRDSDEVEQAALAELEYQVAERKRKEQESVARLEAALRGETL